MEHRLAYVHGFSSGPASTKGVKLAADLARLGRRLELPDCHVPSFGQLTIEGYLSALDELDRRAEPVGARWCLVGSSLGGYAAARWAGLHPDRVHRLVLLCPAFDLPGLFLRLAGTEALARWERDGVLPLPGPGGKVANVHWGFIESVRRQPACPKVPCATVIVHGRQDEVVPVDVSRRYAADHPQVRLVEVDDGHLLEGAFPRVRQEVLDHFDLPRDGGDQAS